MQLRRDPSLRFRDSGRSLLRWLENQVLGLRDNASWIDAVPRHCTFAVADVARSIAEEWLMFAELLSQKAEEAEAAEQAEQAEQGGVAAHRIS